MQTRSKRVSTTLTNAAAKFPRKINKEGEGNSEEVDWTKSLVETVRKTGTERDSGTITNEHTASDKSAGRITLTAESFNTDGTTLAKFLLGKVICRKLDNTVLSGRIVETEAYLGEIDKACHAYGGKKTERTSAMYMPPGTAYVYFIYGMYHCLNVSSSDVGGCVLIRALEPLQGQAIMQLNRKAKRKTENAKPIPLKALCNGPSKLCTAMNITKEELNKVNMAASSIFWIEEDTNTSQHAIVTTTRIGIDSYGPEWAQKPLRFYILNSTSVSVRDKSAEKVPLTN